MFGYVRAYSPEMKMCEYEYYRAAYCGLCRAMGRCTGCASRCMLNYDFAFLALVRMAIVGETPEFKKKRCFVHPTKKRTEMVQQGQLDYCACASVLLSYHKVRDDIADERGIRRFGARMLLTFMRRMHKRAAKKVPGLDESIAVELDTLSDIEKQKCASVDIPAESCKSFPISVMARLMPLPITSAPTMPRISDTAVALPVASASNLRSLASLSSFSSGAAYFMRIALISSCSRAE